MRALPKHSIEILPINHKQFGFDHLRSAVTSPWLVISGGDLETS